MTDASLPLERCPICGTVFDPNTDQGALDLTGHDHPEIPELHQFVAVESLLARAAEMVRMMIRVKQAGTDDEKLAIIQQWVEEQPK